MEATTGDPGILRTRLVEAQKRINRLEADVRKTVALRDLVLRLNHLLVEHLPLERYLQAMLEDVVRTLGHRGPACILLADGEGRTFRVVAPILYDAGMAAGYRLRLEDTFQYRETGGAYTRTIVIRRISRFMSPDSPPILDRTDGSPVECSLSSPIFIDGKLYGIINLDSADEDAFDRDDIEVMEYVRTQVGIVLRHFELLDQVARLSRYDEMTNLRTRRALDEVETMLEGWNTGQGHSAVSIAMIDLDGLKRLNDRLGHAAGDEAIRTFAQALQGVAGEQDLVVRMGGDEFLVAFAGKGAVAARATLESAQRRLYERGHGDTGRIAFSYGIAQAGIDGDRFDALVTVADARLYDAKSARWGCLC